MMFLVVSDGDHKYAINISDIVYIHGPIKPEEGDSTFIELRDGSTIEVDETVVTIFQQLPDRFTNG